MTSTDPYDIQFAPAAARTFRKLASPVRLRIRNALERLAGDVASPGRVSGKAAKTIQGAGDSFYRLRVGEHRVMYDVVSEDRVLLVLGMVHRGDLERWLRNR